MPMKIWMNDDWVHQFDVKDFMGEDSVEYIRSDVFIDKAKKWFNSKNGIVITDVKALFEEFIDYIGIE